MQNRILQAFSFAFQVSTFLSLLNPNQKKYRNTLLFFLLASDLYPMSRNKTLHSSSCTLLSFSLPPPLFSSSGNHQKVLLFYSPSKVFQTRIYRLRDSIERVLQNKQREQETKSPRQFGLTSCQCCSYLSGFGERSLERRKRMKKKKEKKEYTPTSSFLKCRPAHIEDLLREKSSTSTVKNVVSSTRQGKRRHKVFRKKKDSQQNKTFDIK